MALSSYASLITLQEKKINQERVDPPLRATLGEMQSGRNSSSLSLSLSCVFCSLLIGLFSRLLSFLSLCLLNRPLVPYLPCPILFYPIPPVRRSKDSRVLKLSDKHLMTAICTFRSTAFQIHGRLPCCHFGPSAISPHPVCLH